MKLLIGIIAILCISSCTSHPGSTNELNLINWTRADNFKLPQNVISFFYDNNTQKLFTDMDNKYSCVDSFTRVSHITETHYIIQINHVSLNIRERDFKPPFLILNDKLYFTKTHFLIGKLRVPQDLDVYYVDLKSVLK